VEHFPKKWVTILQKRTSFKSLHTSKLFEKQQMTVQCSVTGTLIIGQAKKSAR
jgi:uncharacterized glyoxalase superfamily metalloenzyme YdcJ